jgi:hypothetical protein
MKEVRVSLSVTILRYGLTRYPEGYGKNAVDELIFAVPGVSEKGYLDVKIEVATPGGHSSIPPAHTVRPLFLHRDKKLNNCVYKEHWSSILPRRRDRTKPSPTRALSFRNSICHRPMSGGVRPAPTFMVQEACPQGMGYRQVAFSVPESPG